MNETAETATLQEATVEEPAGGRRLARLVTMLLPLMGLTLVIVPFSIFAENFRSLLNFKTVVIQTAAIAIAGTGMTFIIISGGIDLSVGSVLALVTVATALSLKLGAPAWLCGFLNGAMITVLRVVPFIATLGMWSAARGVAKWLAQEQTVYPPDSWLNSLMLRSPKPEWLALEPSWFRAVSPAIRGPIEQIALSPGLWIMIVTVIVMTLLLRYTTFGRYTIATGSNEATARLCGVRVNLAKLKIYTLSGLLTGVAGLLLFSRLGVGDPTGATGQELDVIAAVVIGGGSLSGGEGSILGTLIGALAMAFMHNGGELLGWGNYIQEILIGIFIVLFVAIDQLRRARSTS